MLPECNLSSFREQLPEEPQYSSAPPHTEAASNSASVHQGNVPHSCAEWIVLKEIRPPGPIVPNEAISEVVEDSTSVIEIEKPKR
jgi:hypothetical protein